MAPKAKAFGTLLEDAAPVIWTGAEVVGEGTKVGEMAEVGEGTKVGVIRTVVGGWTTTEVDGGGMKVEVSGIGIVE